MGAMRVRQAARWIAASACPRQARKFVRVLPTKPDALRNRPVPGCSARRDWMILPTGSSPNAIRHGHVPTRSCAPWVSPAVSVSLTERPPFGCHAPQDLRKPVDKSPADLKLLLTKASRSMTSSKAARLQKTGRPSVARLPLRVRDRANLSGCGEAFNEGY